MEINITQLQELILPAYIKAEKPLLIHGTMGIGKSMSLRQVARRVAKEKGKEYAEGSWHKDKYSLIDVRISQLDPSDLRGIPFPEGKQTRWLVPSWLPREGEGILFMDEINLACPSIQASCYQLILDKRLGDYVLPKGWTIVAAGNRAQDKANVFPMAAPLKNRFSHIDLTVPTEEMWREWACENEINSDIVAFMAFKPTMLFKFDSKNKDNAFPTPRTWALTSEMIKDIKGISDKDLDAIYMLASSCVGEGAATEFSGFVKLKKQVNIDDILKNPKKVKDLKEPGLKYTLVSGLSERYRHDRKRVDVILGVVKEMDNEFGVFLLRLMKGVQKGNGFIQDLMKSKHWEALSGRFDKFLL